MFMPIDPPAGDNPYAAPLSPVAAPESASDKNSADWELRACIGRNAEYYLKKWHGALRGRDQGTGFNWAAFLFGGLWLPYRKMYRATLILYGSFITLTFLEIVFQVVIGTEVPTWLDRMITLAIGIACGAGGNRWYLSHVARLISQSRSEGLTDSELRLRLERRGGTNILASLGMFAVYLVVFFAFFAAVDAAYAYWQGDADAEEFLLPEEEP